MKRRIDQSVGYRITRDVSKVLQEAAAPIFVRHPCNKSSDGIWNLVYDYGGTPCCEPMTSADVRKESGEAVDDYNMSVISPVSSDKYACNVYSALVEYLDTDLSNRIKGVSERIRLFRRGLERAEAELEEIRLASQRAWVMAKVMADEVREAIEQYEDCSASDMEYWAMEINSTLVSVGRNEDGSMDRPVNGVSLNGKEGVSHG